MVDNGLELIAECRVCWLEMVVRDIFVIWELLFVHSEQCCLLMAVVLGHGTEH